MKISSRLLCVDALLITVFLLTGLAAAAAPAPNQGKHLFFVGTDTNTDTNDEDHKTTSKGIYAYRYDASTGQITPLGLAAETTNPSWIALDPNGRYLYAVNEVRN